MIDPTSRSVWPKNKLKQKNFFECTRDIGFDILEPQVSKSLGSPPNSSTSTLSGEPVVITQHHLTIKRRSATRVSQEPQGHLSFTFGSTAQHLVHRDAQ